MTDLLHLNMKCNPWGGLLLRDNSSLCQLLNYVDCVLTHISCNSQNVYHFPMYLFHKFHFLQQWSPSQFQTNYFQVLIQVYPNSAVNCSEWFFVCIRRAMLNALIAMLGYLFSALQAQWYMMERIEWREYRLTRQSKRW